MAFDYEYFKKEVFALTKIDLNAYKEKQMKRRIDTLIAKHKVTGYDKFVAKLRDDKVVFDDFVNYLTINVSEFYRNPEQWRLMDKEIIPELIGRFGKNLKIWSAACSTGDEPYSLVWHSPNICRSIRLILSLRILTSRSSRKRKLVYIMRRASHQCQMSSKRNISPR